MFLSEEPQDVTARCATAAADDDNDGYVDGQLAPPLRLSQLIKEPNGSRA